MKSKMKKEGPDLSRYIANNAKRYVNYRQASIIYSVPYYAFVKMAKDANACWKIRKTVIVDLDKFDSYLETKRDRKD